MTEEQDKKTEVDDDFAEGLGALLAAFSKEMKENPTKMENEFEYPMEISGIKKHAIKSVNCKGTGSLVSIRPCADKYGDKTYLGIYLGDIPIELIVGLYTKTNNLTIMTHGNPAIFVPDLKKIIYGCESWWGKIETEEQLKEITNDDIDNVWYVKLLKQMGEKEDGQQSSTSDNETPTKDK